MEEKLYRVVELTYPDRCVYIIEGWDVDYQIWKKLEPYGEYYNKLEAINTASDLENIAKANRPIKQEVVW